MTWSENLIGVPGAGAIAELRQRVEQLEAALTLEPEKKKEEIPSPSVRLGAERSERK